MIEIATMMKDGVEQERTTTTTTTMAEDGAEWEGTTSTMATTTRVEEKNASQDDNEMMGLSIQDRTKVTRHFGARGVHTHGCQEWLQGIILSFHAMDCEVLLASGHPFFLR